MPQLSYDVMRYINDHLNEDIGIELLSHQFYMNRSYLSRKFKDEAGCSIREYIILKRVALAKTLLQQGKSVSETCEACGFHDYTNFIRTFKKYAGVSPGQFTKL